MELGNHGFKPPTIEEAAKSQNIDISKATCMNCGKPLNPNNGDGLLFCKDCRYDLSNIFKKEKDL